jgi:hypothetical protein
MCFRLTILPPCFSRVITRYLIGLDGLMPDDQRLRLRPYGARLAGTAGTVEIERRRAEYLALAIVRVVLARALHHAGYPDHAAACEAVTDRRSAGQVAVAAHHASGSAKRLDMGRSPAYGCATHAAAACSSASAVVAFCLVPYVAEHAVRAIRNLQDDLQEAGCNSAAMGEIWEAAIAQLDGLFAIGSGQSRQASCAAGRAALIAAVFDVPWWAHEPRAADCPFDCLWPPAPNAPARAPNGCRRARCTNTPLPS